MPHSLHQQACVGIARDDSRTGIAALEQSGSRVKPEAALFVRGVTVEARLDEDRPDLRLEELDLLRRRGCGLRRTAHRRSRPLQAGRSGQPYGGRRHEQTSGAEADESRAIEICHR